MMKTRGIKKSVALALSCILIFSVALTSGPAMATVQAADDSKTVDNFNRAELDGFDPYGELLYISNKYTTVAHSNGEVAVSYSGGPGEYFGLGGEYYPADYKYLVIKIKGALGGEGSRFSLTNEYDYNSASRKLFSSYIGPDGKAVPKITTSYRNIAIDLKASGLNYSAGDKFLDINFMFDYGMSGKIFIDEIYLTNTAPAPPAPENPCNLFVSDIRPVNATVFTDDNAKFYTVLRNASNYNSQGVLTVDFYQDGALNQRIFYNSSIKAGGSAVIPTSKTWRAFMGSHTCRVIINSEKTTDENNYADNNLKVRFKVMD